jgi:transposase-like protein
MEADQNKRRRRTSIEIKKSLEVFRQSGLSVKAFCKLHNISEAGFYKWRKRYADHAPLKKNSFIVLKPQPILAAAEPALFAEIKGIKLYQAVEASYLKELLA